jgi:hypothetical protein
MTDKFQIVKVVENDVHGTVQCAPAPYNDGDTACFGACPSWGACHDACCGYPQSSDGGVYKDTYNTHWRCGWPCNGWFGC